MRLKELIKDLSCRDLKNIQDCEIKGISCNSDCIQPGYLFVAIKGERVDGHNFVNQALSKGARTLVLQQDLPLAGQVPRILVADSRAAFACISAAFFGHPAKNLRVIGITGTNGKTTVSYLLEKILHCAGYPCGVIGTVNYRIGAKRYRAVNTTPQADILQSFLQEIVLANSKYAIIEVSSHALAQHRAEKIDFCSAIFTNLSPEHRDYHGNLTNYFSCKSGLFAGLKPQSWAIINVDDSYGRKLAQSIKSRRLLFAIEHPAQIRAKNLRLGIDKINFTAVTPRGKMEIESSLIGKHNVYNVLAAISAAFVEGISPEYIVSGIKGCVGVPGRLERLECGQNFSVFIDYAHTGDALKKILNTLRETSGSKAGWFAPHRRAKIILVFGCGGDRDKAKRPLMGKVATTLSDFVILTNDNPRSEDPEQIVADIIRGIDKKAGNYKVVLDRFQAIREAISLAGGGDIVVVAGKGHESSQIFAGETIHFSDREAVKKILQNQPTD